MVAMVKQPLTPALSPRRGGAALAQLWREIVFRGVTLVGEKRRGAPHSRTQSEIGLADHFLFFFAGAGAVVDAPALGPGSWARMGICLKRLVMSMRDCSTPMRS